MWLSRQGQESNKKINKRTLTVDTHTQKNLFYDYKKGK